MKIDFLVNTRPERVIGIYFLSCIVAGLLVPARLGNANLSELLASNVPMFNALSVCSFEPALYRAFFTVCSSLMLLACIWMPFAVYNIIPVPDKAFYTKQYQHPLREILLIVVLCALSYLFYLLLIKPDVNLTKEMLERASLGERYGQTRDGAYRAMFSLGLSSRIGMSIFFSGLMTGAFTCISVAMLFCIGYWRNNIQRNIHSKQ